MTRPKVINDEVVRRRVKTPNPRDIFYNNMEVDEDTGRVTGELIVQGETNGTISKDVQKLKDDMLETGKAAQETGILVAAQLLKDKAEIAFQNKLHIKHLPKGGTEMTQTMNFEAGAMDV